MTPPSDQTGRDVLSSPAPHPQWPCPALPLFPFPSLSSPSSSLFNRQWMNGDERRKGMFCEMNGAKVGGVNRMSSDRIKRHPPTDYLDGIIFSAVPEHWQRHSAIVTPLNHNIILLDQLIVMSFAGVLLALSFVPFRPWNNDQNESPLFLSLSRPSSLARFLSPVSVRTIC